MNSSCNTTNGSNSRGFSHLLPATTTTISNTQCNEESGDNQQWDNISSVTESPRSTIVPEYYTLSSFHGTNILQHPLKKMQSFNLGLCMGELHLLSNDQLNQLSRLRIAQSRSHLSRQLVVMKWQQQVGHKEVCRINDMVAAIMESGVTELGTYTKLSVDQRASKRQLLKLLKQPVHAIAEGVPGMSPRQCQQRFENLQRLKGILEDCSGFELAGDVTVLEHKRGIIEGKWKPDWGETAKNIDGQDPKKCNNRAVSLNKVYEKIMNREECVITPTYRSVRAYMEKHGIPVPSVKHFFAAKKASTKAAKKAPAKAAKKASTKAAKKAPAKAAKPEQQQIQRPDESSFDWSNDNTVVINDTTKRERYLVELEEKEAVVDGSSQLQDSTTFGLPNKEFVDFIDDLVVRLVPGRFQTEVEFSNWLSNRKSEWKLMRNNKKRKIVPKVPIESHIALVPGRRQPKELFNKWLDDRKIDWESSRPVKCMRGGYDNPMFEEEMAAAAAPVLPGIDDPGIADPEQQELQQPQAQNQPDTDDGDIVRDDNGKFFLPPESYTVFLTSTERQFTIRVGGITRTHTISGCDDQKRIVITGTFQDVDGVDDIARYNILKRMLEHAGAKVTFKVSNLTDYVLVGDSPCVEILRAVRRSHLAHDAHDPESTTTRPHLCKLVTLVRLQNLLIGSTNLDQFNSLPRLDVARFMENANPRAFRVSYEERLTSEGLQTFKVRTNYRGNRLCHNETCPHDTRYPLKEWYYKCTSCCRADNNILTHEKIIRNQLHELELTELSVESGIYTTGEESSLYRYDFVSSDIASENVIMFFEIDAKGSKHFAEKCTDVPRAMETFECAKSIAGNTPCILVRFFSGYGPHPLPEIAECIADMWHNREANHLPNLEGMSEKEKAAAVEIQDKVILVGMPEKGGKTRLEEYAFAFGKQRVKSMYFGRDADRNFSELCDDGRIEEIDLDRLDGCRKKFGVYYPIVNNRRRQYESSFFYFHQNNGFDPRLLGASVTPDVQGTDGNPLLDTYRDIIANSSYKPENCHRVKVIRRLQRLVQRFVREESLDKDFEIRAITYEMYTMQEHKYISKMKDLAAAYDLELFPDDDVLYIENAFKLLREDITLDDIQSDDLKEKLTLFVVAAF